MPNNETEQVQYIGARYITKIYENSQNPSSAEWEAQVNYEPLTLVTYQNSTYLSRTVVPKNIGNPADNGTYWALTGAYNGQIASLQNQIDALNGDVDALERALGTLDTTVGGLVTDVDNLEGAVSVINNKLAYGKVIFVSDSYANSDYGTLFASIATYLGLTSEDWYDGHVSGGSFGDGTLLTGMQTLAGTMTSEQKAAIKHIDIFCGINDAGRGSLDIINGITAYITYCKSTFPNADYTMGYIGNIVEPGSNNRNFVGRYTSLQLYSQTAGLLGVKFVSGLENILHDYSLMGADGVHPNANGTGLLARYIANSIRGGQVDIARLARYLSQSEIKANAWDVTANIDENISAVNMVALGGRLEFLASQNNGVGHVEMSGLFAFAFGSTPITISMSTPINIGKMVCPLFKGTGYHIIPVHGVYGDTSNNYGTWTGGINVNAGNMSLEIYQIDDNWNISSHANVNAIVFNGFSIDLPTFAM